VADAHNVIIVGGGPAGLTAAVYAARANLAPLVIEGYGAGGQLMTTTDVENYPGFPDGVQGPELMQMFRAQAERFGARIEQVDATRIDVTEAPFRVWVDDDEYRTRSLIIATGATARWLGLESEAALRGFGVSTCATCDGFFFKDRRMVVVGGGDSAMEEAIYLARMAEQVTIVHRRDAFRASKIMADRALRLPNVDVRWNSEVDEVIGDGKVETVRIRNVETDVTEDLSVAAMFVAIGHDPATNLFAEQIDLDEEGYIVTDGTRTNVSGVFACGDVQDTVYRQAVTAAGSGCMAAIDAERWLETAGLESHTDAATASA
jgi:thioredoxin reductase (NADPH)